MDLPAYGTASNAGSVWRSAATGDLDRDGLLDLVVAAPTRNHLYLNEGAGRFRAASAAGVVALPAGSAPLLLDYDNDGDLDIS